jgi:ribonuclease D
MNDWHKETAYKLVQDDLDDELFALACSDTLIAWDIETTGLDWQTCRITMCQLYGKNLGVVLVRLEEGVVPPNLCRLLANASVAKVFHHAPFDLGFMRHYWKVVAANVACTKVAAKTLHPDASSEAYSLRALVKSELGIGIDKTQRLSDWSAPQLSSQQITYAMNDVVHLPALYATLCRQLADAERLPIYSKACAFLPTAVEYRLLGKENIFGY